MAWHHLRNWNNCLKSRVFGFCLFGVIFVWFIFVWFIFLVVLENHIVKLEYHHSVKLTKCLKLDFCFSLGFLFVGLFVCILCFFKENYQFSRLVF